MVHDYNCHLNDVDRDMVSLIQDFRGYIPDLVNNVRE